MPPTRTCIGCRRPDEKRNLVRFVRGADGDLLWDPAAALHGRGAYTHRDGACWDAAVKKRAFARALRASVTVGDAPDVFRRALA